MKKKAYLKQIDNVIANGSFKDDWASLSQFKMPEWFTDAKFGIFIHWGVFSVPAFGNEWYSRNMYVEGSPEFEHHIKTYGPQKNFGYKDFIPMFKAEKFDPEAWVSLFREAGAKYIVPVAEHHDGFQMYMSDFSDFNAAKMGPHRDVIKELETAAGAQDMIFCTSSHRAEHWFFMGPGKHFDSDIKEPLKCGDFYWPATKEQPDFEDLYSKPYPTEEFLEDWLARTCEIVDRFQPKLIYFDWWIQHEAVKPYLKKFIAYYYNRAAELGYPAAVCYKHDCCALGSGIFDIERGKFAEAKPYHWQTDTAIARNSWCYTTSLEYKSAYEIICYLADVVAKNGNLLLNIGPKADGTIAETDTMILKQIGEWLRINGEAVYGSGCWHFSGEGPTAETGGQFSDAKATEYTPADFRFTVNNGCIYAISLKYPENGHIHIRLIGSSSQTAKPLFHGIIKNVSILGSDERIEWTAADDGLQFTTKTVKSELPVVIKIETD